MHKIIATDYQAMSRTGAEIVAKHIKPGALICLAAGDTPMGMFKELIAMQHRGEVNLADAWYVGLDEWMGLGQADEGSCIKMMTDAFYGPANIPSERILTFDGLDPDTHKQCRQVEAWIAARGGITFTMLGIGMNGHIGFNEPGTPDQPGCFAVDLDDTTQSVSAKYFGKALPITQGVTIGWRTLHDAPAVLLMANGAKKAPIINQVLTGPITADVPASLFRNHPGATILLDKAATM